MLCWQYTWAAPTRCFGNTLQQCVAQCCAEQSTQALLLNTRRSTLSTSDMCTAFAGTELPHACSSTHTSDAWLLTSNAAQLHHANRAHRSCRCAGTESQARMNTGNHLYREYTPFPSTGPTTAVNAASVCSRSSWLVVMRSSQWHPACCPAGSSCLAVMRSSQQWHPACCPAGGATPAVNAVSVG